jgi:alpha-1,3-rhamnosyl/mannosyltransferase
VDRGVGDALIARAAAAGAADLIVRLGPIAERPLLALYRSAVALVYPSLYEGFGFPVLEAMAAGAPVIASRAASVPEVLGDAGILLDPRDPSVWAEVIVRVMTNDDERAKMVAAGRTRAAAFTWERTARATVDVYERALQSQRGRPRSGTGQN